MRAASNRSRTRAAGYQASGYLVLAVVALGVDLKQDRDAVPGLLGGLGACRRVCDLNSFLDRRHRTSKCCECTPGTPRRRSSWSAKDLAVLGHPTGWQPRTQDTG